MLEKLRVWAIVSIMAGSTVTLSCSREPDVNVATEPTQGPPATSADVAWESAKQAVLDFYAAHHAGDYGKQFDSMTVEAQRETLKQYEFILKKIDAKHLSPRDQFIAASRKWESLGDNLPEKTVGDQSRTVYEVALLEVLSKDGAYVAQVRTPAHKAEIRAAADEYISGAKLPEDAAMVDVWESLKKNAPSEVIWKVFLTRENDSWKIREESLEEIVRRNMKTAERR